MDSTATNESLFVCGKCPYFRQVVSGPMARVLYEHPIYGLVTYRAAAEKEIENHQCDPHMKRIELLHLISKTMEWDTNGN